MYSLMNGDVLEWVVQFFMRIFVVSSPVVTKFWCVKPVLTCVDICNGMCCHVLIVVCAGLSVCVCV